MDKGEPNDLFHVFFFFETISPCGLGCPGIHCVDYADLRLPEILLPLFPNAVLKVCATMHGFLVESLFSTNSQKIFFSHVSTSFKSSRTRSLLSYLSIYFAPELLCMLCMCICAMVTHLTCLYLYVDTWLSVCR